MKWESRRLQEVYRAVVCALTGFGKMPGVFPQGLEAH
jgi:hypothetical protein